MSLTQALQEVATVYEKSSGHRLVFNFAASSTLALQIQEGAPADVFFSADEAKMNALEAKELLLPGTRRSLLSNTLVIVVPRDTGKMLAAARDLLDPTIGRVALAEPQSVPAGIYAKQYLETEGIWEKVSAKVVPTENVRAALAAVESGNVDAGIVYKTDVALSKQVRIAYEVPAAAGPAISYPVAALQESRHAAAATDLVRFLGSAAALEIFARHGFGVTPLPK